MQGVEINAGGEIILKLNTVAFTSDGEKPSMGKVIDNLCVKAVESGQYTPY